MRYGYYFLLSLKKTAKLLPYILTATFVLVISGAVIASSLVQKESLVGVGMVGDTDDSYINIASSLLTESQTMNIIFYDSQEDAVRAMKKREIQGYAYIPDDFISQATRGKNVPLTYNVLKSPTSIAQAMTKEVVLAISPVVYNSQNAVFGMRQYLKDIGRRDILEAETNKMSARYVADILQRDRLFDVKTVGVADSVTTENYYTIAIVLFWVLICGTVISPYMIKKNMALPSLLASRGVCVSKQIIAEWGSVLTVMYLLTAVVTSLMGQGVLYGLKLLPALMVLTSFQFLMYEISASMVSGLLLQFFGVIIFCYVSGFFYPSYFFPILIQKLASVLPTAQGFEYARQAFSGTLTVKCTALSLSTAAITILACCAVRRVRMRGESI